MEYRDVIKGVFLQRPNRFIARVLVDGKEEIAHVKNTGRCKELLIEGVTVYLEPSNNPRRKTAFSLVTVEKGNRLINMDSQAPNKVLLEAFRAKTKLEGFPRNIDLFKSEYTYGNSRLDFYLEHGDERTLVEVKGVTLEEDGVVLFPDAPTLRGIKHIHTIENALKEGYHGIICFIIAMDKAKYFTPNNKTHPEFGRALIKAEKAGVKILAFDCTVTPDSLAIKGSVTVKL